LRDRTLAAFASARRTHSATATSYPAQKNAETLNLALSSSDKTGSVWAARALEIAHIELESGHERFERRRDCGQQRLRRR
jgi:hypothetical protein